MWFIFIFKRIRYKVRHLDVFFINCTSVTFSLGQYSTCPIPYIIWVAHYMLNNIPGVYTNEYSICVRPWSLLKMVSHQNVTPMLRHTSKCKHLPLFLYAPPTGLYNCNPSRKHRWVVHICVCSFCILEHGGAQECYTGLHVGTTASHWRNTKETINSHTSRNPRYCEATRIEWAEDPNLKISPLKVPQLISEGRTFNYFEQINFSLCLALF